MPDIQEALKIALDYSLTDEVAKKKIDEILEKKGRINNAKRIPRNSHLQRV